MSKKLAGTIFYHNAISQDYCVLEAIECLLQFCDHVYIVDAGSTDDTYRATMNLFIDNANKVTVISTGIVSWMNEVGKEKLSHFTNMAIEQAQKDGYEYVFNLQADEILHEKSHEAVRKAIDTGQEGFIVNRINLWGSPATMLDVSQERKPCSTHILRLAKSCYRAYDDAESLAAPASTSFMEDIRIYHMGFVRDRKIHPAKIRHMQAEIFRVGVDPKLEGMEVFDPYKWFSEEDLKPLTEPLPAIIQKWALARM